MVVPNSSVTKVGIFWKESLSSLTRSVKLINNCFPTVTRIRTTNKTHVLQISQDWDCARPSILVDVLFLMLSFWEKKSIRLGFYLEWPDSYRTIMKIPNYVPWKFFVNDVTTCPQGKQEIDERIWILPRRFSPYSNNTAHVSTSSSSLT
jgi:hypothetical protein